MISCSRVAIAALTSPARPGPRLGLPSSERAWEPDGEAPRPADRGDDRTLTGAEAWCRGELGLETVRDLASDAERAEGDGFVIGAAISSALAAAWSAVDPTNVGDAVCEAAAAAAGDFDDPTVELQSWQEAFARTLAQLAELVRATVDCPDLSRLIRGVGSDSETPLR